MYNYWAVRIPSISVPTLWDKLIHTRGIYVPDDERWPAHFRGIGIRIEDSVCVGDEHPIVLTPEAVKEVCLLWSPWFGDLLIHYTRLRTLRHCVVRCIVLLETLEYPCTIEHKASNWMFLSPFILILSLTAKSTCLKYPCLDCFVVAGLVLFGGWLGAGLEVGDDWSWPGGLCFRGIKGIQENERMDRRMK